MPSTPVLGDQEVENGDPCESGYPGLYGKFQANQDYTMRSCLKEEKEKEKEDCSFLEAAAQSPSKCQPYGWYNQYMKYTHFQLLKYNVSIPLSYCF